MDVIDIATAKVIATISVGSGPTGVAVTPDNKSVYVTNQSSNSVSVIDTATNTVKTTISSGLGTGPDGIAMAPDGRHVYVVNFASGTVSVISTATNTVSATITVGTDPIGIAVTPDGTGAYVTNSSSNTVSVIDTSTNTVSATINSGLGSSPQGIAITPDGTKVYVANYTSPGTVSVIDVATNTVTATTTVGNNPIAFGQFIQPPSIPMTTLYVPPQGRLTLTSNTPVMTADATAQTSVYYTPFQGNILPIYDGANMDSYTFGQLTMSLNTSNQTSGNLYDLFAFLNLTAAHSPPACSRRPGGVFGARVKGPRRELRAPWPSRACPRLHALAGREQAG